MTKPVIAVTHPMLARLGDLLANTYVVYRLWEPEDLKAFAKAEGQAIRAFVHLGEMTLEPDLLGLFPNLQLIACVSAGYDGVDTAWCHSRGISVTHSQGDNAADVADVAMGLLISAWRGMSAAEVRLRTGLWVRHEPPLPSRSLAGTKAGIVGLGHIGAAIAHRLDAFGVDVAWWGPNPKPSPRPRADSLMALAQQSDILVVCNRAEASNRGLISAEVIRALGPRGCLINVSRGSVVDEDALIAALKSGQLGMAALDVFETEPTPAVRWAGVPNMVLTPHIGGATQESVQRMVGQCLENLQRFFAGAPLLSPAQG